VPPLGRETEFGAPRSDTRLVLNIDLAPTIADLMGAAAARSVDGVSLLPALADPSAEWHTDGGLELWADDDETAFKGLRSGRWKYLRYDTGEEELYDLEADPYELDNLARDPDQAPRLAELSARTSTLMR
jgi:arylsulfatase A-like enzyme